ncbi:hypothetical protein D9623_18060 [Azospirillum brasilense]|uniref:Uncharacterized protein n=1 Tax=Azospirillum brasilense TaxID=192 RepID=A0A4D8QTK6_AZOBR|nr:MULTISPECIES: hypothetical protein [Azospirillum]MDW7556664.1 hypothetical protein [Azospirillum brasilense]MDW7596432.1 hypothetical protein [Azospirillum brasilense]MDW7631322.1 hypothetical protein [Azospirillum brasilense]MDX5951824.1 hypothetical protein [Azospirillum brasilense]QCO10569.1 hypothetical protein D3868_15895 [Azospirillum brasilense]
MGDRVRRLGLAAAVGSCLLAGAAVAQTAPQTATQGPLRLVPQPNPFPAVELSPPQPIPVPPQPSPAAAVVRPGQPVANPAPIPQTAPSADPAQFTPPTHRPQPTDRVAAVRAFYEALGQADAARANTYVVPEKRGSGAYDIASMSRFYGNMSVPIRLLAAEAAGRDAVRVRYHYVHVSGRACDGAAEVALAERDGLALIERIRALNDC